MHAACGVAPGIARVAVPGEDAAHPAVRVVVKLTWLAVVGLPQLMGDRMDAATTQLFAKNLWVVIILAVIPWGTSPASTWSRPVTTGAQRRPRLRIPGPDTGVQHVVSGRLVRSPVNAVGGVASSSAIPGHPLGIPGGVVQQAQPPLKCPTMNHDEPGSTSPTKIIYRPEADDPRPRADHQPGKRQAAQAIGDHGRPVSGVAAEFGMDWRIAPEAFIAHPGDVLSEAPPPLRVLGVDETRRGKAHWEIDPATRQRVGVDRFDTRLVDLAGEGGLFAQVNGRTSQVLIDGLQAQEPAWRSGITHIAMDTSAAQTRAVRWRYPTR